ncbi:fatty acid desaturase family protein [uncultured Ralstonia sp.]|jgi:fatty acid desaturase|uniref:fatty acid desaturase family protein n=1 Tax=Ralstonia sp. TaxID=54061 RepID=UPI001EAA645B|nr:fatty acid desaturase family protein [uncultured Ralstonia sp.]UCF25645.1 MAG: fatty acid desaturase family protein [Ralstonia sp.]
MSILNVLDKAELKALTTPSDLRAWWVTGVNFALIAAAFALPAVWHHPVAWVVASIVLAGRALGLGILTHDAAHLAFFSARRMNEWAGTWLFGGLPNVPYQAYRKGHLEHHRTAGTEHDPDLAFVQGYPATRASLARKFLRDVSGINGVKNLIYQVQTFDRRATAPFLVAHGLLFGTLWALGVPQVYACWWIGMVFFFPLFVRLRVMSEHGTVPNHVSRDPRENTGTTLAGPLGRLLIGPNRVNFHVEHHLAASVPSYRLPAMHRLLVARGYYAGTHCVAPSYCAVVRKCMAARPEDAARRSKMRARGILDNMR